MNTRLPPALYAGLREELARPPGPSVCWQGHPRTRLNTYRDPDGRDRCARCIETTRAERRAAGLCPHCGQEPDGEFVTCADCRAAKRDYWRRQQGQPC